MKHILSFFVTLLLSLNAFCQLTDGSTAPDFSFSDINGNKHHLYDYLNQGKFVMLEVSTTWCGPCWDYHTIFHDVLDNLYKDKDIPGDQTGKVLMIEADPTTTIDDVNGNNYVPGQLWGTTNGDWTKDTPYPICNPTNIPSYTDETPIDTFLKQYDIQGYPTHMIICPDRKVWIDTFWDPLVATFPERSLYNYVISQKCGIPTSIQNTNHVKNDFVISPNPACDFITIQGTQLSELELCIYDLTGKLVKHLKGDNLHVGNDFIKIDISWLKKGMYFLKLNAGQLKGFSQKLLIE